MKIKNINVSPGDYVKISLIKKDYIGIVLEVPEDEKGIVLLKLDSGYNIGIKKIDILDAKVLKKFSEKQEKLEIKKDKEKLSGLTNILEKCLENNLQEDYNKLKETLDKLGNNAGGDQKEGSGKTESKS